MFTSEEKEILDKYVTSPEANVFALKNMQGMAGAAYARYSRAKGGFREVLLKEFIEEGNIDPQHADALIERVLVAYGDDSVGELEGAHVSFERISNIATKEIEDRRIGGSYIEQSTRYVLYDQKDDNGNWLYYRGPEILNASYAGQYRETMDHIFRTYAELVETMKQHLQTLKPIEAAEYDVNGDGQKEKFADITDPKQVKAFKQTYTFELRAKACDILRTLLPVATLTNVGVFGNGRYYQNLISFLLTSELPESHAIAAGMQGALKELIPQYVRRAKKSNYLAETNAAMGKLAHDLFGHVTPTDIADNQPSCRLLDKSESYIERQMAKGISLKQAMQEAADNQTLATMVYPYVNLPLEQLRQAIIDLNAEQRLKLIEAYIGNRQTRRDRPGRALEDGYPYTFDLVAHFGVYKDLQRHRTLTLQRQLFTTKLGFFLDPELEVIGAKDKVMECVRRADDLFEVINKENPILAQYAPLHGHYVRWTMGMNDRALMHLAELRSTPQGHPNYRTVVQKMHHLISERSTWRGTAMKFVDHENYYWSRADSEARQRVKEAQLEEKLNKQGS